ncbi:MAG: peptide deformylase [Gemmatimonadetes bacterium]|nr:peptide deformylase [Gemmatimonadota bacterium]
MRNIHLLGSPVLRQRAAEIATVDDEVRAVIADLFETMRFSKGVGLAANQVGIARRVAVVETDEQHAYALVNPVLVERAGSVKDEEGCLSIPDIFGDVERAERVVVEAGDEHGKRRRIEGTGLLARAMQHEIDHLDGILFIDRVGPLKRRRLIKEWEKSRKGQTGYIKELAAEGAAQS